MKQCNQPTTCTTPLIHRNCGVMVSVLLLSVVDHSFKPWSCQTKDYKIGICCFFAHHAALRRKTGWLGITIMCPSGSICLSQTVVSMSWHYKDPNKRVDLVPNEPHYHLIKINLFSQWCSRKIYELTLNNNHSHSLFWSTINYSDTINSPKAQRRRWQNVMK